MNIITDPQYISNLADLEESVRDSKLILAAGVRIDSFVKIKFAGGLGDIIIDENVYINSGTVMYSGNGIKIGRDVMIAANCTLAPTNHAFKRTDIPMIQQGFMESKGGIIIEDDVWIGANSVILDGSHIKKGAIVAAGSVVRGIVESNTIVAGNPQKKIRNR
ncbi:acyltransferase [Lysinibacillus pakistanensis]|uniref:acyltransferase n=1 Tax=Lysinibacillus pakistanensis TaxID=759811 RepID=UPI003D2D8E38